MKVFQYFKMGEVLGIAILLFILAFIGMRSNPYAGGTVYDIGFFFGTIVACYVIGLIIEAVIAIFRFIKEKLAKK